MPRMYRLKNCPVCDKEHRKEGIYCCRAHYKIGVVGYKHTEETKQKISETRFEYLQTDEGIAHKNRFIANKEAIEAGEKSLGIEDYMLDIPTYDDLDAEEKINL